ncbi:MAG TPA: PIG-L family deacetylase [Phycisphaerae bacterium]|nr:PIG-L family deacetylase [Phycisphaerae bacterium]
MAKSKGKGARILVFGAHPDDCEFMAGGLAALCVRHGLTIKFVSMTNGDTGHYQMGGGELARRRYAETRASAKVLGIEYEVVDQHCGELMPTLEHRRFVIRTIRLFKPDLVLTHTPDDYHPDHRYTSTLVQDSAYSVTVPGQVALTPHLNCNPVYGYICGTITKSPMFAPTVFLDLDGVMSKKFRMLCCHESQFLEWIPYNQNVLHKVPKGRAARRKWMTDWFAARMRQVAEFYRPQIVRQYGPKRGARIRYVEAIQFSPLGSEVDARGVRRLLPFVPAPKRAVPDEVARSRWVRPPSRRK